MAGLVAAARCDAAHVYICTAPAQGPSSRSFAAFPTAPCTKRLSGAGAVLDGALSTAPPRHITHTPIRILRVRSLSPFSWLSLAALLLCRACAMLGDKKRSSHRLSSLFSVTSSDSGPVASSESGGRLSKIKNRVSSHTLLAPDYPPPPPPNYPSNSPATISPVDSAPAALDPPPPIADLSRPQSRSGSPGRLAKSRPGTPNAETAGGRLTPVEGNLKKLRRRSRLFGGGESSDERLNESAQVGPLAWVVGHKGKVPYNLTMLLNGEKARVKCLPSTHLALTSVTGARALGRPRRHVRLPLPQNVK